MIHSRITILKKYIFLNGSFYYHIFEEGNEKDHFGTDNFFQKRHIL